MTEKTLIFAVETSCDETSLAVVDIEARRIVAQRIYSQIKEHTPYGGVVPEVASRAHLERLPQLSKEVMDEAGLGWNEVHAVAATVGPGLTTALVVGSTFAKSLAVGLGKPFLAVNHIEGHALSPLLVQETVLAETFLEKHEPYLLLLVTGGHCQLVRVDGVGQYVTLGSTLDDAVGECFDKVGKLLGLPHPAGPAIETLAKEGNAKAFVLPHPKTEGALDFSFSGLKTAVRELVVGHEETIAKADVAASFQHTVAVLLGRKLEAALKQTGLTQVVVAGGVAANKAIRAELARICEERGATLTAPPLILCTDNAAMIGYAGGLRWLRGLDCGGLETRVLPRWPLEEMGGLAAG